MKKLVFTLKRQKERKLRVNADYAPLIAIENISMNTLNVTLALIAEKTTYWC